MARCDGAGVFDSATPFRPGDDVRIGAGPFLDFVAWVEELALDQRVWVLLDLMGRKTRIARIIPRCCAPWGPERCQRTQWARRL
ncbi:hypothetical protein U879_03475 [Defluviimonas sp. 20V17]|nr:hypothetical protein U879_03475 [Defluviimonas sp. 20V17]